MNEPESLVKSELESAAPDKEDSGLQDQPSESTLRLLKPISDKSPCGENVLYDPNFETAKAEIDKISENDFELITELCGALLREKTKDLMVASYYALGLVRTDGVAGLAEGLHVLSLIAETFWEDLFPPMKGMVARRNAIQFFAEKASAGLEGYRPNEDDRTPLSTALARLKKFQAFTLERMDQSAPTLSGLKRVVEDIERRLPKVKKVEESTPRGVQTDDATGSATGPPSEIRSVSDSNLAVSRAVSFLREKDSTSPVPYRVIRALRWSAIKAEPPHESGKTRLPAPIAQRRTRLSSLLENGEAETLIVEAESFFRDGSSHFWIDLQRLIVSGMRTLGDQYQDAWTAILEETAILMKRVPGLVNLTFADGETPIVSAATADWLAAEVVPLDSSGQGGSSAQTARLPEGDSMDDRKTEAIRTLAKRDLTAAISHMREGSEKDRSAKDRFIRQLHVADLCMKGKRPSVARPILENLDKEVEVHGLQVWDPDLALSAWTALYSCYRAMGASASATKKQEFAGLGGDIFEKICRIDAAFALSLPER